jgi:peptide/nickel transport system substrate-binding protein
MNKFLCQVVCIIRNFSLKEKIFFFALAIVFLVSSILALWKINNSYLVDIPADGGILTEGIIGTPRFINPVLAISDADRDMTALIYSGLMRPDNKGGLIPDLAEKFEISEDGLSYTFTLKSDLVWQDGEHITSDDIVFTIQQAKDPSIKSPKRASWEGVSVERIDDKNIRFVLSKPYTPFLENTTLGILPKHIWKDALSEQMSFSEFNINPICSGPYKVKKINRNSSGIVNSYELIPNKKFALDKPHIKTLVLHFYPSEKELLSSYQRGDIDSISAITPQTAEKIKRSSSNLKTPSLPRVFAVFFNQNNAKIFSYKEVRYALNLAIDKKKIIDEVLQGFGTQLEYPIPAGTFGALSIDEEKTSMPNIAEAKALLEKNGWAFKDNVWQKKEKKEVLRLEFSLATSDAPDLKQTAELLKAMWEEIGVKVNIKIFEIGDLNQNIIRPRKYDSLLFGEIVGRDPDPFVFWHSSQRNDPGLNIALYANIKVDNLLEQARTSTDEDKRRKEYGEFQKELIKDMPAVFLFSPKFIYLMPNNLKGTEQIESITVPSERFSQIYKWYVKTDKVWKIFAKGEK